MKNYMNNQNEIEVGFLEEHDLEKAVKLWGAGEIEARRAVTTAPVKQFEAETFGEYLKAHLGPDNSVTIKEGNSLMGYLVYDIFEFHGGKAVFSPVIGHAAQHNERDLVYKKIYQQVSEKWIAQGVLNHYLTYFASDNTLTELFFKLGFGLYVVDAYRNVEELSFQHYPEPVEKAASIYSRTEIIRANLDNLDDIITLERESQDFYRMAPLFLVREPRDEVIYQELLEDMSGAVFLARVEGEMVGFINIRQEQDWDINSLADPETGMIDPLGAYIRPRFRGRGIGKLLLKEVINWCQARRLKRIHVDFESANLYGSSFWSKYFTPYLYSVKRTVNRDIVNFVVF